jgi:hypothetical protein
MSCRRGRSERRRAVHQGAGRPTVRERADSWLALLSPVLFAAAFVLDRFANTNSAIEELPRPLVLAVAIASLLMAIHWAILRDRVWASMGASTIFLILVFYPVPALVMIALLVWLAGTRMIRGRRGLPNRSLQPSDTTVRVASLYSIVLLIVGVFSSSSAVTASIADPPDLPASTNAATGRGGPDIYLLLLDGYPRDDTLLNDFGFDNSSFESELGQLGFTMAPAARSNYNKTWLTVASMLNAQYVQAIPEIADPPSVAPAQARLAHGLINHAAALQRLRDRGYTVISIPSPVMTTDVTENAQVRATGHLSSFEIALASGSLPAFVVPDAVLGALASDARENVVDQLALVSAYATAAGQEPRIVLAHLMSPHPPFLLGQEPDYLRECFPACKLWELTLQETRLTDGEYAHRMSTQVEQLNRRLLETVGRIARENPPAIVILMSDHGARHDKEDVDEQFRSFFAARTPGFSGLFSDDQSPVNIFRRILSAMHADDLADLPYEAWESDWGLPLVIRRYH